MFKRFTNACVRVVNRWLPDAFLFAVILTFVVYVAAMFATGMGPIKVLAAWGNSDGFWGLLAFSMQMALVLVLGSAMASAKPCKKVLRKAAGLCHNNMQAIVITGGEPLLYPLGPLTSALKGHGLKIFLETSGSHPFSGYFDWVCLSPKRQQPPLPEAFWRAHELKVIVEREADLQWAERNAEQVGRECKLFLQPEWSVSEEIMPLLVEYVKAHPAWNISIQTHKYMHIP